jgi:hypothetical protein
MFKQTFCSLKQEFLLQIDFIGLINKDTFSVAPSTINENLKNMLFHQKITLLFNMTHNLWRHDTQHNDPLHNGLVCDIQHN